MRLLPLSPLIARTSRVCLLGCLLIFSVATVWMLMLEFRHLQSRWRTDIEQAVANNEAPLAQALWNYDSVQLHSNLSVLVQLDGLFRAEIYDEQGQLLASAAQPRALTTHVEVLNKVITEPAASSQPIGRLRIYISDAQLHQTFWRVAYFIPLYIFIEIAVVAVLLFFLLHRNVISPLLKMARAVGNLDLRKGYQPVELERGRHAADEIDDVAQAINKFQREILDERAARSRLEQESRTLGNELMRMGRVATVQSLTTTIAHELNQPLGAILSNVETIQLAMLDKLPADDPMREVLGDIAHEARRAGSIIRNLRNLTQQRDAEQTALSLSAIVREVVELAQFDTRWESTKLELELVGADVHVLGVAVQLQQVVLNLIANARDAIRHADIGDGRIVLCTELVDSRFVRLTVSDNGPGIAAQDLNAILQPFFTTKEGGTGMGLWIAQMIVEQHGGKLEAGNLPGGGAYFTFTLPVVQA